LPPISVQCPAVITQVLDPDLALKPTEQRPPAAA
jgi:hypothetical protein